MVDPSGSERAAPAAVTPGIARESDPRGRVEPDDLVRVLVGRLRQRDPHREDARGIEPEIDPLQRPERPQHQARADEQDDRQRHLRDHEAVPETPPAAAGRCVAPAFFHRVRQVRSQQARGGGDAEDHGGDERDADREQQHAPVDGRARDTGNARWVPPREQAHTTPGQRQTGGGADTGEHETLGQQLPDEAGRAGPERRAHGHLALPRFRAREEKIGHVGAGDEQQEADRAEEEPDRAADGTDDLFPQREDDGVELHRLGIEPPARPRLRDGVQVVARLRDRSARLEPARRVKSVISVVRARAVPPIRRPQRARRRILEIGRQHEVRGHDPDDLVRRAVDLDRAAEDRRVAGIPPLPEAVAEDRDLRPVRDVLLRREDTSPDRRHAEDGEQVRRHGPGGDALGVAVTRQVHLPVVPRRDLAERAAFLAIVVDLAIGNPGLVERRPAAPDHDGAVGLAPWQRAQQDGVDDAEDRRVRADAERERQIATHAKPGLRASVRAPNRRSWRKGVHSGLGRDGLRGTLD